MKIDQRTKVLLAILVALLLVASWRFLAPALGRMTGERALLGGAPAGVGDVSMLQVVDLHLDTLNVPAHDYTPGRNIFRPYMPPPPPPPYVPPPPAVVADSGPPPPPPPPVPPRIDFELVGIFGPEKRRLAVLSDGKEIINALVGEAIHKKFIVDRIGLESIDVRFVGFPDVPARRVVIEE